MPRAMIYVKFCDDTQSLMQIGFEWALLCKESLSLGTVRGIGILSWVRDAEDWGHALGCLEADWLCLLSGAEHPDEKITAKNGCKMES